MQGFLKLFLTFTFANLVLGITFPSTVFSTPTLRDKLSKNEKGIPLNLLACSLRSTLGEIGNIQTQFPAGENWSTSGFGSVKFENWDEQLYEISIIQQADYPGLKFTAFVGNASYSCGGKSAVWLPILNQDSYYPFVFELELSCPSNFSLPAMTLNCTVNF